MATEKLEIVVGADVQDVVKKLDQIEKTATAAMGKTATSFEPVKTALKTVQVEAFDTDKAFREAMDRISDTVDKKVAEAIQSFDKLEQNIQQDAVSAGKAIKTLQDKFNAFGGISGNKAAKSLDELIGKTKQLNPAVSGSTQTLINFSRVVQDAPFGIIGIANNIDPLVSSFTQLKASTGSAGAAFKALAGSLIGPAGIALAVSTVTSLLIAYTQNQQKAASETKKAKDEFKSFGDIQKEVSEDVAKESSRVAILVGVLNEEGVSRKNKVNALKELKTISPEYFDGLKFEDGLVKNLSKSYAEYVKNIGLAIEAKTIEKQLEQITAKLLEGKIQNQQNLQTSKALANVFKEMAKEGGNTALSQKLVNQTLKSNVKLTGEDVSLIFQKNALFNRLLEIYKIINIEQKGLTKETKAGKDILEEYRNALGALTFTEEATGVSLINEKLNLAIKTFQQFLNDGLKPTSKEFQFINSEVNKFLQQLPQLTKATAEIKNNLDPTIINKPRQTNPINVGKADRTSSVVITDEALQKQGEYLLKIDEIIAKMKQFQEIGQVAIGGINAGIDQFFNALANNQDPFEALAQSVKRLVAELAAAVVKMLILKAISAALTGGASAGLDGLAGGGGGVLDFFLRGDLLTGAVTRSAGRRRGG